MTAAGLALAGAAGLLAAEAWRQRRRAARLARRVETSNRELERLQGAFSRFVPAEVVDEVATSGLRQHAEKIEATVLFADLQGFTALSETLEPDVLVEVLNGYFRAMSEAITAHHGHVSKFLGDGIMAFFGALEKNPWAANDACHAALAMRARLAAYNAALAARGLPALKIGVGIHRGAVVAGIVGSDQLMEYTLIGDTVNVAARVESLTRAHGVDVLVTAEVVTGLDPSFALRALPPAPVKGKSAPIPTWTVERYGAPVTASK